MRPTLALVCALALTSLSHAQTPPAPPAVAVAPMPRPAAPVVSVLPNGARLVVLPDPSASSVVFDVFFRVGRGDEGRYSGITALLTRSWLTESETRSKPLLQADIAREGAAFGSNIGGDWAEAWAVSATDTGSVGKTAQTLLTNLVAAPAFGQASVETGRDSLRRAAALRRDDLVADTLDTLQARVLGASPDGGALQGSDAGVESIPWAQVGAFYRRVFRPDRAVIVVSGPITPDAARRVVVASLGAGDWGGGDTPRAARPLAPTAAEPVPAGLRPLVVPRRGPAVCVAAGFIAPGLTAPNSRSDWATLLVLDAIIGGGKGSRLFALRESGAIGYEVRTALLPGRNQSVWAVYVVGDQPAAHVTPPLLALLDDLSLGKTPVTDAELARAKAWAKGRHTEERQRERERAGGAGWAEVMGLGADFDTDFDTRIDAVTPANIERMTRRVLGNPAAVVHTLPSAAVP